MGKKGRKTQVRGGCLYKMRETQAFLLDMTIEPVDKDKDHTIQNRNNLERDPGETFGGRGGSRSQLEKGCLCLKLEEKREVWVGGPQPPLVGWRPLGLWQRRLVGGREGSGGHM